MSNLTKNEEIILLSIIRLKENAYGVSIKNKIRELTGGDWNYGLLYATLDQLVKKDLPIVFSLGFLIIFSQTVKAAAGNPADSLRYE